MPTGGTRSGAGRPRGAPNKATAEIKELARQYSDKALAELARLMENAESEATRVAACKEILDRAYGRAPQAITGAEGGPLLDPLAAVLAAVNGATRGLPSQRFR